MPDLNTQNLTAAAAAAVRVSFCFCFPFWYIHAQQDTFYLPTVATFEPPTFAGILEAEGGDLHFVSSSAGAAATNAAGVKRNVAKLFGDPRRTVKREYFEGHEARVICVGWTAAVRS